MVINTIVCIELPQPTLLNPFACKHLQLRKNLKCKQTKHIPGAHYWQHVACKSKWKPGMLKMKALKGWNKTKQKPYRLKAPESIIQCIKSKHILPFSHETSFHLFLMLTSVTTSLWNTFFPQGGFVQCKTVSLGGFGLLGLWSSLRLLPRRLQKHCVCLDGILIL